MGSRYLVTGADLGMLMGTISHDPEDCKDQINKLLETRFVIETNNHIDSDIKIVREALEKEEAD